jgi:hypothetical protein
MQSRITLEHLESDDPGALSLSLGHTRGISEVENMPGTSSRGMCI